MRGCKLCKTRIANKKNSHIISKFLGKGLFTTIPHRYAIAFGKNGIKEKIQDTVKEDYIFCKSCEKRMELVETFFAKKLREIYAYEQFEDKFRVSESKGQEYLEAQELHPNIYKLFFYLQAWRLSISKSGYYKNYKLDEEIEEKLRRFLDLNLQTTHKALIQNLDFCIEDPELLTCFIIPKQIDESTRGIYTAYQFYEESYILLALHFAFMLFTDAEKADDAYKLFGNRFNETVKIALGNRDSWKGLNLEILNIIK